LFLFGSQTNCLSQENQENNKKKFPLIFNEFTGSVNYTFYDKYTATNNINRLGFGVSICKTWFDNKWINLLVGISYGKFTYAGGLPDYYSHSHNTYFHNPITTIQELSVPIAIRFNLERSKKLFIELKTNLGWIFHQTLSGTEEYVEYGKPPTATEPAIPGKTTITSVKNRRIKPEFPMYFGFDIGLGVKIPLKKNELLLKVYYQPISSLGLAFGYRIINTKKYDVNQEKKDKEIKFPVIFNEFTASLNYAERFSYGVGIYRYFFEYSWANLILGLSYNQTSFDDKNVTNYQYPTEARIYDQIINIHSLSLPITARLNIGKSFKGFIELGGFCDFNIKETGTHTYKDNGDTEKIDSGGPYIVGGGITTGLGLKIPLKKNGLLVKLSTNFGFIKFDNFKNTSDYHTHTKSYFEICFGYRILQNKVSDKGE
jgi:hypothetical protein